MGETEVTHVSNGVGVLYYKDGKMYLTPKQAMSYWDEDAETYEYYFEDDDKNMYLIVDEKKREKWLEECGS